MKILYCAYGKAGLLVLDLLFEQISSRASDIFCITYDYDENINLLRSLEKLGVMSSTLPIIDKNVTDQIDAFEPHVIFSIHYRDLIPGRILEKSALGGINLHPSLLPKYRGAFSAPWAIINKEKMTGITYHFMNEKFDDGRIILQKSIGVSNDETGCSLFHKLIKLGAKHFLEAFDLSINKGYKGAPQKGKVSYYPRELPFGGRIDPSWGIPKIERFIRAMTFPPKPYAKVIKDGKEIEVKNMDQYRRLFNIEQ